LNSVDNEFFKNYFLGDGAGTNEKPFCELVRTRRPR